MFNIIVKVALAGISIALVACTPTTTSNQMKATVISDTAVAQQNAEAMEPVNAMPAGGPAAGGSIARNMSGTDKDKFSRGLDSGIGKSASWTSDRNGMKYTVTPTKKITVGSNPNCRTYRLTATKDDNTQTFNGTACIADDGSWQEG